MIECLIGIGALLWAILIAILVIKDLIKIYK